VDLLVLGPQGAGKGTQAKRIAAEYELPHVSTGDMFRAAIAAQTELGKRVQPILASGALVPDDVTVALIRERLGEPDAAAGFVLDGFPRNLAQAEALDEMLRAIGRSLDAILFFDLPDTVATERMLRRRGEPARRHARRDRAPTRDLPRGDRADRRVLPRDWQAGAVACRASDRAGLGRDRLGAERT
jgi:adenylate kinase